MLLGGYLVKRFNLSCRGIIRMCAGFMFTALLFGPFFLASCPNDPLIGLDDPYIFEYVTAIPDIDAQIQIKGYCCNIQNNSVGSSILHFYLMKHSIPLPIEGSNMIFHSLTFARSRGKY